MKRNLKITISALAVMLVMALAVTIVSFSLAGDDKKGEFSDDAVFVSATVDTNSNIDNIIENSYATGTDVNPVYRIVEIGSGAEPTSGTAFKRMVLGKDDAQDIYGDFEEFVINGNKSMALQDMNPNNIDYKYFSVSQLKDENEENLAIVSNADFIYVSNDAGTPYSNTNDMGEELYNFLHTYAVGDYKPLVIDNIGESAEEDDPGNTDPDAPVTSSKYSFAKLIAKVFDKSGKYYYTFKWTDGQSAADFVASKDDSNYLAINGDKKQQNWTVVTEKTDATAMDAEHKYSMAEFLIVSAGSKTMSDALLADVYTKPKLTNLEDMSDVAVEGDVYDIQGTSVYNSVYNAKKIRPHYVRVTTVTVAEVADLSLDAYDLVIIEGDCANDNSAIYNKFSAAMYGRVNMIYSSKLATETPSSSGSGTTGGNAAVQQKTNYSELFYMVATNTGQARYENILITDSTQFSIIAGSKSAATCKVIADLINASAFRGNGGQNGSANKFTVLEIQPCYPIDTALAESKNDYYTVPSEVMNGKTKEELDEGTEYYAWELSKAKIAHAFGLTVDQVTLVQMSSEQLASTKEDILGKYDLVYIGGNISALKSAMERSRFGNNNSSDKNLDYFKPYYENGVVVRDNSEDLKKLPVYDMYSHNGDPIQVNLTANKNQGGDHTVGTPAANAVINGKSVSSFSLLNGNDISYANLNQLKDYVNAGMPVVFSSRATYGYDQAVTKELNTDGSFKSKSKNYLQNSIDPDSNMYKFMDYCDSLSRCEAKDVKKNILWSFNETLATDTDSNGGDYGSTQTGYVKVFDKASVDMLHQLYLDSSQRPKLTLTQSPAIYNMYDESSYIDIDTNPMTFAYKISGSKNYTVTLYVDDDGNSVFDENEDMKSTSGTKLSLTADDISDDFSGPIYWKLSVVDNTSKQETSVTGISYISPDSASKQKVRVLQILPGDFDQAGDTSNGGSKEDGEGAEGSNSLYFCTICQQAYRRLEYNPTSDNKRMSYANLYSGNYFDKPGGMSAQGEGYTNYLGLHEHEFGIVKYDSSLHVYTDENGTTLKTFASGNVTVDAIGADDWDSNLADEVSDRYDFDLDIMMRSEFVVAADEAHSASYDFSTITDENEKAQAIADAIATNPYAAGTDEYKAYEAATTSEEKLAMVKSVATADYEAKQKVANTKYMVLSNSLIKYTEADLEIAFADYDYLDELKVTLNSTDETVKPSEAQIEETGYTMSTLDAEIELRNALMALRDTLGAGTFLGSEVDRLLETRHYWDFYCIDNGKFCGYWDKYDNINILYAKYIQLKDEEINANNEYKKYSRYISGSKWIYENYDMVVIGASEDFAKDDIVQSNEVKTVSDTLRVKVVSYNYLNGTDEFSIPGTARQVTMNIGLAEQWGSYKLANPTPTIVSSGTGAGDIEISGVMQAPNGDAIANQALVVQVLGTVNYNTATVYAAIAVTDENGNYKVTIPNYTVTHETVKVNGKTVKADNALFDLEYHMMSDGKVFLFHDTVTKYSDVGSVNLTNLIRKYSGMDRNHMTVDTSKLVTDDDNADNDTAKDLQDRLALSYYVPYMTTDADGDDVYFMTDMSVVGGTSTTPGKYTNWSTDVGAVIPIGGISGRYLTADAYTDAAAMPQTNGADHVGKLPYKYAEQDWATAAYWMRNDTTYVAHKLDGSHGSNKASQTNKGIVTLYPFTLSDQLNISATHTQAYALDLEDRNLTVWYSLGGGSGKKEGSSIYAASPNDGMDNYFIYTYRNFNYCGAGHANVTGVLKDNNDERRLYINIICNSVKPSVKAPGIDVYDYESTKDLLLNKKYVEVEDGLYVVKVDDVNEYPEFSFRVRLDDSAQVERVRIYYDLDCPMDVAEFTKTINEYEADDDHPLILEWYGNQVLKNTLTYVYRYSREDLISKVAYEMKYNKFSNGQYVYDNEENVYDFETQNNVNSGLTYIEIDGKKMPLPVLKLREEYFTPYGGSYTYIVIEVEDSNGKKSYARIKIQLKDKLFNLT